ncbi:methyltransferase-like protein 5 [Dendronephthya gigantea]|uniref:methyltransferase-like protein 5 n=1 Tax=Dendronephthya gigantea TaxID=151771 RepID=UPI00106C3D4E|nr:methyltransferase-like protein 5 [Dendronephthya gigantea]
MKLKQLEGLLQNFDVFEKPKVHLEQYPTTPHIASHMLYTIDQTFDDIQGGTVADLGCGCGILSVGAAILGSDYVVGFDIDADALEVAKKNLEECDVDVVEFIQCNVADINSAMMRNGFFDTVIMNPPFGTKNNAGIDVMFLEKAIHMANQTVYSLHKTSTRHHIDKKAKQNNVDMEVVAELKFNLDASLKFHRRKSVDIEVDFIRFDVSGR